MLFLRKVLNALSRRFPEQLVITKQDYTDLRQEVAQLNVAVQAVQQLNDRLSKLERNVEQLNTIQGFTTIGKASGRLER